MAATQAEINSRLNDSQYQNAKAATAARRDGSAMTADRTAGQENRNNLTQ
jgi:hypothetical protein